MIVYFRCPLVQEPGLSHFWRPKVEVVRRGNGMFPARWSSTLLGEKYAVGVAEVTAQQLSALQQDPTILIEVNRATAGTRFSADAKAAANKDIDVLEREMAADIARRASASPSVLPVAAGLVIPSNLSRRQLLKLGAMGAAAWYVLRPGRAYSTVVFTDSFTTGSNTDLNGYNSDYLHISGGSTVMYVNAANDRVQASQAAAEQVVRMVDGTMPTANQKLTATCFSQSGALHLPGLTVRSATDDTANLYLGRFDADGGVVNIYRADAGSYNLLNSQSRSVTYPATCSIQVVGTGATVDIEVVGGGTSAVTYSDTDANRKTAGTPGLYMYDASSETVYIDDVSVDDMAGVGSSSRRRITIIQ